MPKVKNIGLRGRRRLARAAGAKWTGGRQGWATEQVPAKQDRARRLRLEAVLADAPLARPGVRPYWACAADLGGAAGDCPACGAAPAGPGAPEVPS